MPIDNDCLPGIVEGLRAYVRAAYFEAKTDKHVDLHVVELLNLHRPKGREWTEDLRALFCLSAELFEIATK